MKITNVFPVENSSGIILANVKSSKLLSRVHQMVDEATTGRWLGFSVTGTELTNDLINPKTCEGFSFFVPPNFATPQTFNQISDNTATKAAGLSGFANGQPCQTTANDFEGGRLPC